MPAVAVNSMLDLIGGTPLVRLRRLVEPGMADVFHTATVCRIVSGLKRKYPRPYRRQKV
jgi:cysteine synthase